MVPKTATNSANRANTTVELSNRESAHKSLGRFASTLDSGKSMKHSDDSAAPLRQQPSPHHTEPDFLQILQKAKSGDQSAIGELCEQSRRYLLLIANQDLNADMLQKFGASDVVQQSMIVANKKLDHFDGSTKREFMAWMRQILINECRQTSRMYQGTEKRSIRRERSIQGNEDSVRPGFQLDDPHRTPSTNAAAEEQLRLVHLALGQMDALQRSVIEMRNWQELSFEEIGQAIGKSAEASRKIWSRAIIKLEQELNNLDAI